MRLAAVDLETGCLDVSRCSIVAAALVPVEGNRVELRRVLYAVTEERSRPEAVLVHGIVAGRGHAEPNIGIEEFLEKAASYVLITYGSHDARFLVAEAARRGILRKYCYIDLLALLLSNPARRQRAASRGHYLLEEAVAEVLHAELEPRRLHDPLEDAVYTALLYLALKQRGLPMPKPRCIGPKKGKGLLASLTALLRRAGSSARR